MISQDRAWSNLPEPISRTAHEQFVSQALDTLTIAQLRQRLAALGWTLRGTRRAEILEQAVAFYLDPEAGRAALDRLDAVERRLLQFAAVVGFFPFEALVTALAGFTEALPGRPLPRSQVERALRTFHERGYLLELQAGGESLFFVPPAFQHALRPLPELAPPFQGELAALEQRRAPLNDPVAALYLAWETLRARGGVTPVSPFPPQPVPVQHGAWPVASSEQQFRPHWREIRQSLEVPAASAPLPVEFLDEVAARLGRVGRPAAAFFGGLLMVLGLAVSQEGRVVPVEDRMWRFLNQTPLQQRTQLLAGWTRLSYGLWDEVSALLAEAPDLEFHRRLTRWGFSPEVFSADLSDLRLTLFVQMGFLPGEEWRDAGAWLHLLGQVLPGIVYNTPASPSTDWFLARRGAPLDPEHPDGWASGAGALLALVLRGPLTWLGLIETATAGSGQVVALRITPWGKALLADSPPPIQPAVAQPCWRDDLAVELAPSGAAMPLVALLAQVAAVEEASANRLRYRFTAARAAEQFARGVLPAELTGRFDALGASLPENVRRALDTWWERWGLLRRYDDVALLEVSDELLVRELLSSTSLARYVIYQIGPRHLAVRPEGVEPLVAELELRGYFPKVAG